MATLDDIKTYVTLLKEEKALKRRLDEVSTQRGVLKESVLAYFAEHGVGKMTIDSMTLSPRKEVWVGYINDEDETGVDHKWHATQQLKEIPALRVYVTEQINLRALTSLERELRENDSSLLTTYPQLSIALKVSERYEVGHRRIA